MRAYFFGNMYLSSIQQGIQAAHVVAELFIKYDDANGPNFHTLREWAVDHKTMILLNAGYGAEIHSLVDFFQCNDHPYPWAQFYEEPAALDGAITMIGIILPPKIYDTGVELYKANPTIPIGNLLNYVYTFWEQSMVERLPNYGLAR